MFKIILFLVLGFICITLYSACRIASKADNVEVDMRKTVGNMSIEKIKKIKIFFMK